MLENQTPQLSEKQKLALKLIRSLADSFDEYDQYDPELKNRRLYNHAYSVCFSVETNEEEDPQKESSIPEDQLISALLRRIATLIEEGSLKEAIGLPFDSYKNEPT